MLETIKEEINKPTKPFAEMYQEFVMRTQDDIIAREIQSTTRVVQFSNNFNNIEHDLNIIHSSLKEIYDVK